ncbi:hypothetical protein U0C82_12230 [Fulvimarina sp. 2208YS6-2-32]|uniref:Uncharacterized protein n=1 Tax=Fulvimarina uroteuthidis TaxID=3098149 RepID=A0ABU5I3F6_9HYPH|nr:hypothetical protein [Fulvimarina sp. 2208YS6-2-32]MDY8109907.1 hypothetical protein [Fulvimarina sp. 2208YS6-2-32]
MPQIIAFHAAMGSSIRPVARRAGRAPDRRETMTPVGDRALRHAMRSIDLPLMLAKADLKFDSLEA